MSAAREVRGGALLLFVSAFAFAFALAFTRMQFGGDTFFYLAAGDYVLDHGALPSGDPFALTSMPGPWLLHFPLCQIGFSAVSRTAGLLGLHIFGAAIATTALLLLWWPSGRTLVARLAALAPLTLGIAAEPEFFALKGQLVAVLWFALLLLCLQRLRRGARVHAAVPVLLGALWVNTHPSFLLVLVLPIAALAVTWLDPQAERPPWRPFVQFALLGVLATGITPYGYALPIDTLALFTHPATAYIGLFHAPDFREPMWLLVVGLALGLAAMRYAAPPSTLRASDVALLLMFLVATLYSQRYVPFLATFEAIIVGTLVDAWRRDVRAPLAVSGALSLALVALAAVLSRQPTDVLRTEPVEATLRLQALRPSGNLLNLWGWGGYLSWRWKGEPKVFIDGRANLFSKSVVEDYLRLKYAAAGYEELLDLYAIETVLWRRGDPIAEALEQHPGWREVHRDDLAVIFTRR